jgi:glycyl-tRNA synthetase alpha chain
MRTFQDIVFELKRYWSRQGCLIQEPYDIEVGAGTMCPETFLRVLGPQPSSVAYVQPSRRPADGRYGDNPNRLYKHMQLQVLLKPAPADVIELYMKSLEAIGIDLRRHDFKLEEDNWEAPTLGAWGIGWQVMLDGLEITQFTYFQQCGGMDLELIPVELTYGLERLTAFIQDVDSVYDIHWNDRWTFRDIRFQDELQFSIYNFEKADVAFLWQAFDLYEKECRRLLDEYKSLHRSHDQDAAVSSNAISEEEARFPLLPAYDCVLKCSHVFNLLDSRGAISVTERVAVIARVRALAVGLAQAWVQQQEGIQERNSKEAVPA